MKPTIIAFLGKGGSGKSILSSLTAKLAIEKKLRVLLIDADPAMGLATALDVSGYKTMGEARAEIIRQAKIAKADERARLSEIIDYLLLEALYEKPNYSLLVMGHTDTVGCYCPINSLLRETIDSIAANYDLVVIDAEAGIEQINREVTRGVSHPILLTDNSMRGAKTTILASTTIKNTASMNPKKVGVIFNRVETPEKNLTSLLRDSGLDAWGTIPPDPVVTMRDAKGASALSMPEDSVALGALRNILEEQGVLL